MGTRKFTIKTFESLDRPVVEFKKKVIAQDGKELCISPGKQNPNIRDYGSFSIDIHEIDVEGGNKKDLRQLTELMSIELFPDWVNKSLFDKEITQILNRDENPSDVVAIAIRLTCPRLNYVIDSKRVGTSKITSGEPIVFRNIDLNDVSGKLVLESELVRTKSSNPSNSKIAFNDQTVLAKNRSITFYLDEIEEVGGTALPISPGDTGGNMFLMKNLSPLGVEPPSLVYDKRFKSFFNNGDDYETVQSILILIGLPYCEQLLKWIVYGKPDYSIDDHQSVIKLIAELCETRDSDLEDITRDADAESKSQKYLELSSSLFKNVQLMGKGWRKLLYQIVENERR